jgi:NAD+ synthase
MPAARIAQGIVTWLRDRLGGGGPRGFVVGLSGGIDSAVVARLCQLAAAQSTIGVLMPCHSDPRDEADARLIAEHYKIPTARVDLAPTFDALQDDLLETMAGSRLAAVDAGRSAAANLKPRLRMVTLYYLANSLNYYVVGTGNRSELTVGYFTKYGDGGVDLLPIGRLLKRDVRAVARHLGVPYRIVEKAPSAGLWEGQTDEEEMGFTYADLESYLEDGPEGVSPALAMRIERLIRQSEHKRALPPVPNVPPAE